MNGVSNEQQEIGANKVLTPEQRGCVDLIHSSGYKSISNQEIISMLKMVEEIKYNVQCMELLEFLAHTLSLDFISADLQSKIQEQMIQVILQEQMNERLLAILLKAYHNSCSQTEFVKKICEQPKVLEKLLQYFILHFDEY